MGSPLPEDTDSSFVPVAEGEFFYLWDEHQTLFEIYQIVRNWANEYNILDSASVIALLNEQKLSLTEGLRDIPLIHYGYLKKVKHGRQSEQRQNGNNSFQRGDD